MSFLLDTNICSAFIRNRSGLTHRFIQHSGRLHVASIVLGELYTWAYRRSNPTPILSAIQGDLLPQVQVLSFDMACASDFGKLKAQMLNAGRPIDSADLQIAVTAIVHGLTLVTHNTRDFEHLPGLHLDDWLMP
jgi:tRNA(fMet)-specific endonuclease VapC